MSHSTVVALRQPDTIDDPLTAVLRDGARRLLAQAIEAEAEAFLAAMKDKRLVRHEHGPGRYGETRLRTAQCVRTEPPNPLISRTDSEMRP